MKELLTEDPISVGASILLALAFLWVLYILATNDANESEKLQYRIEHWKPEEKKDGEDSNEKRTGRV